MPVVARRREWAIRTMKAEMAETGKDRAVAEATVCRREDSKIFGMGG